MLQFIVTYYSISALSVAIISFLIGTFVLRKNIKAALNRAFFFWSFAVCSWAVFYFIWQIEIEAKPALLWTRLLMIGAIWAPVFYLKVVILFLDIKKIKQKLILYVDYFLAILFTILLITPLMVDRVEPTLGFSFWPKPGLAYGPFLIMFMGTTIYSFYLAIKAFLNKNLSPIKRSQILYFLFPFAITIIGGSTNYFLWYNIPIKPYGNVLVLAYFFGTAYAILRYQFMDIKIVMRKGSIYLLLAGFAYSAFYFFIWLFNALFGSVYAPNAFIMGVFMAVVFVALFFLFERVITRIANKYFFGGLYLKHEALKQLTRKLTAIIDLSKLAEVITAVIKESLGLDKIAILLKEPTTQAFALYKTIGFEEKNGLSLVKDNSLTQHLQKIGRPLTYEELDFKQLGTLKVAMERIHASLCLPLNSQECLIGIIVLGRKVSGEAYSKEDIELLEDLSNQASIAIENARLYEQVRDLNENLQEKVAEQTKEIKDAYQKVEKAYEIEKQAHQELKRVDEAKTQFIMATQHHLRTPLTAIKGYLAMVMEGSFGQISELLKEKLKSCFISAERLIKLVNEFLDISTFQLGRDAFVMKETLLVPLLQEVVEEVKPEADKKGIYLTLEKPAQIADKIMADPSKLKEAFYNLIDNAVKYTEKGGVTVKLKVEGEKLKVSIADTGIGMTQEEIKEVFSRQFERGELAKKVYTLGRGIGLYLAANIIKAHQGRVWAESPGRGKGSAFYAELPVK